MIALSDFAGGLNLRDSPNELALNETPAARNWTLDTRGQLRLRNGCELQILMPTLGASRIFYSQALGVWLASSGIYKRPADFSGSWTTVVADGVNYDMVDWPGATPLVVAINTSGGVKTYDGTTLSAYLASSPRSKFVVIWQNRVWAGGYWTSDANGNPARLFASAVGDPSTWAVASGGLTVDIRDKDAQPITAMGVAGGALIVFKSGSTYRVNNSESGAYTLIDSTHGCLNQQALVSQNGVLYAWSEKGLYAFDGVGPGKNVGDKVRPLFQAAFPGYSAPNIYGGAVEDRLIFGYPPAPNFAANVLLEVDPLHKWAMEHQFADVTSVYIQSFETKDTALYAVVKTPIGTQGNIYKIFSGTPGSDGGTLFTANYRTPWLQPNAGKIARILRAQVEGLLAPGLGNSLKLRVYKDWDLTVYDEYDLTIDLRGADPNIQVDATIIRSLGHARSFAFEFVSGTAVGAASVNSLELDELALETV